MRRTLNKKPQRYHKDCDKAVKHVFEAKIVGGKLSPSQDEIMDARWFTLRAPWVFEAIKFFETKQ